MSKNRNQTDKQAKEVILETVRKHKPETTTQLIKLVQEETKLPEQEITNLIIQLENENKLQLTRKKTLPSTPKAYVSSKDAAWFWITIALAVATVVTVFTVPEDVPPISYLRNVLGIVFVLFLPGYAFMKALFPHKLPIATKSEQMDSIERIALSVGSSMALTPMVGLLLYYTPFGIALTPITLSLLGLTVAFATAAVLREKRTKEKPTKEEPPKGEEVETFMSVIEEG